MVCLLSSLLIIDIENNDIDKHVISWYRIIVVRSRHSNDEITLFEHSYHYEFKDLKVINCN